MRLRLDPWAVEYNTAYHAEAAGDGRDDVDTSVEGPWQRHRPERADTFWHDLYFLDGSRRIEARVLLEQDAAQIAFGALGSYGVGVVSCCAKKGRRASFLCGEETLFVRRVCALSSGHSTADFALLATRSRLGELNYQVVGTAERDADAVVRRLQYEMLDAEKQLASRLVAQNPEALIICDGPRPFLGGEKNVIGYLKTIHEPKISESELSVVRGLELGVISERLRHSRKSATADKYTHVLSTRRLEGAMSLADLLGYGAGGGVGKSRKQRGQERTPS